MTRTTARQRRTSGCSRGCLRAERVPGAEKSTVAPLVAARGAHQR
ncbi:hypothetical protein [Streptomyces sp. NRRL F-5053]|nr:hypothetical protein [Streptomyces sp. NRRL F-5053]